MGHDVRRAEVKQDSVIRDMGEKRDMLRGKACLGTLARCLAMQESGEEFSRQRRVGVKGWGCSLCRLDTFLKLHTIPKFLSASFVLCVHQQVPKPLLPTESRFGGLVTNFHRDRESLFSEAYLPMVHRDRLLLKACVLLCPEPISTNKRTEQGTA